jgi:hypothetical protein
MFQLIQQSLLVRALLLLALLVVLWFQHQLQPRLHQ